jgi:hypothetical protein
VKFKGLNMKLNIRFAELHSPLFLGGTNLQLKLDPKNRIGLILTYDRTEKELIVQWNDHVALIPNSNVSSMTLEDPADIGLGKTFSPSIQPSSHHPVDKTKAKPYAAVKVSAQVQDPTRDAVFAGPGAGKVRD